MPSPFHARLFDLGAVAAAVLLIVAAAAFGPGAVKGLGLGIGIAGCAASVSFIALLVHHRRLQGNPDLRVFGHAFGLWSILAGAIATLTIWEIAGAATLAPNVTRQATLANGLAIAALACAGLIAHEVCAERVVHVLETVERPPREFAQLVHQELRRIQAAVRRTAPLSPIPFPQCPPGWLWLRRASVWLGQAGD